jgi:Holliday junction resolvase-like predicted endonuclease
VNLREAFREIQALKKRVRSLTGEIESLRRASVEDSSPVEGLLRMRGIRVFRKNPTERLFFSSDLFDRDLTRFYELMRRYSFRLVLRDMIKNQDGFRIRDLTRYCSSRVARGYCETLSEMEAIVKIGRQSYQTSVRPLYSFGPTLEWFVAEMFKREFASPALYGVSLKKTRSGGDYDVIASWNQRLVYVEVKSSPPKGVEQAEIATFFSRLDDLLPDVAILFNDTQLRMRDKLVVMVEEELEQRYGGESKKLYPVERLVEELFHIQHRIFIVNSRKDVVENFKICLRDYLREGGRQP